MLSLHTAQNLRLLHFQPKFLLKILKDFWFIETSETRFLDLCFLDRLLRTKLQVLISE